MAGNAHGLVVMVNSTPDALGFVRKVCAAADIGDPLIALPAAQAEEFLVRNVETIQVVFLVETTGLHVLGGLRRLPVMQRVPLMVISTLSSAAGRAMDWGADGFLMPEDNVARSAEILSAIIAQAREGP